MKTEYILESPESVTITVPQDLTLSEQVFINSSLQIRTAIPIQHEKGWEGLFSLTAILKRNTTAKVTLETDSGHCEKLTTTIRTKGTNDLITFETTSENGIILFNKVKIPALG